MPTFQNIIIQLHLNLNPLLFMAKSLNRTHSADAANIFVRNLLCDISEVFGGYSKADEEKTLKYFGNKCAYTGKKLTDKTTSMDHLVAHNRSECGLHLYGNIVPCDSSVNKSKGSKSFETFLNSDSEYLKDMDSSERKDRIEFIREFQTKSGYEKKAALIADLKIKIEESYSEIQELAIKRFNDIAHDLKQTEYKQVIEVIEVELEQNIHIDKVERKVPNWFKNPNQNCSKILISFLQVSNGADVVEIDSLQKYCESKSVENFKSNFDQMRNFSKNNHGKIFDLNDGNVSLWKPVKSYIHEKFNELEIKN